MAEGLPCKANVSVLIAALSSADSFVREKAHDALVLTFHTEFNNTAQGKAWWQANSNRYDENLVEK